MNKEFFELFSLKLEDIQIILTDQQKGQFYEYYTLLVEWNKVMNLTTIIDMESVIIKHFIDSLSLIKAVGDLESCDYNIIDVGTGAGFPGIPLKIVFPNLSVTLLDSLNKRINFLNCVIDRLLLKGITAVHGRAEDFGQDKSYRECYDISLSRAVANIATLAEYCIPFVKKGGYFISYKSGGVGEEIDLGKKSIKLLGGKVDQIIAFTIPGTDIERSLVKIKKVEGTSKRYPRKSGLPSKEPLL